MKIYKTTKEIEIPKRYLYAVVKNKGKVKHYTLHRNYKKACERTVELKGKTQILTEKCVRFFADGVLCDIKIKARCEDIKPPENIFQKTVGFFRDLLPW